MSGPEGLDFIPDTLQDGARRRIMGRMRDLAGQVATRRVQFMFGAGMSVPSGLPAAKGITERMLKDLLQDPGEQAIKSLRDRYPLEVVAEAYEQEKDERQLTELVRELLMQAKAKPHVGHEALEFLANQDYIDKVYTTNFDDLLEMSFGGNGLTVDDDHVERIHEAMRDERIPVLHLHGSLDSTYRLKETDIYSLDTPLARLLVADLVMYRFVFVGYSVTDPDIRGIYLTTRDLLRGTTSGIRSYVVYPLADAVEVDEQKLEFELSDMVWKARGLEYIPSRAEKFLPALKEWVLRAKGKMLLPGVAKALDKDPDCDEDMEEVWEAAEEAALQVGSKDKLVGIAILATRLEVNEERK